MKMPPDKHARDMSPAERRAALRKIETDQFKAECEAADAKAIAKFQKSLPKPKGES